jgi:hypothetical protein
MASLAVDQSLRASRHKLPLRASRHKLRGERDLKKARSIWCKAAPACLCDLAMFPSILLKSFVAQ